MKTINKFLILFVSIAFLFSCGEPEKVVYDTDENSSQTLIKFNQTTYELGVVIEESGSIEVQVDATTASNSDRTFQINLIEEESTFIDEIGNFSYDETVTIPAGEFTGTFTVSGTDNGLDNSSEALYVFELVTDNDDYVYESTVTQVSAFRVCPVPADFLVGTYRIEDVSNSLAQGLQGGTTNFAEEVIEIQPGATPLDRTFSPIVLPGILGSRFEVVISFRCGQFVLQQFDLNGGCTEGNTIKFGPSDNPSQYDLDNIQDSYIINYKEDVDASCLSAAAEGSFRLTKIQE